MFYINTISDLELEYFDGNGIDPLIGYLSGSEVKSGGYYVKPGHRVTANIATQPYRFSSLMKTLESIRDQFDEVRIYLNGFRSVPVELDGYTTYLGDDLTDNGKFFWSSCKSEYYFTLDDDIVYPSDYVQRTLPLIGDRVVSYHGRRLVGRGEKYYDNHRVYLFREQLEKEVSLDVAGTGVMAFDTDVFRPTLWTSPNLRMSDLLISLETHIRRVPLVCLPRKSAWIKDEPWQRDGIYWDKSCDVELLTRYADMIMDLNGSDIGKPALNYEFTEQSLSSVVGLVDSRQTGGFVVLRSGNGYLPEFFRSLSDRVLAYETDAYRVLECRRCSRSPVVYDYVSDYAIVDYQVGDFVLLDDVILPSFVSTSVYTNMPYGCRLLCSSIVDGVFPISKVSLDTIDGNEVTFYYYEK